MTYPHNENDMPGYDDGGVGDSATLPVYRGSGSGKAVEDQRKAGFDLHPAGRFHAEVLDAKLGQLSNNDVAGQTVIEFTLGTLTGTLAEGGKYEGGGSVKYWMRYLTKRGEDSPAPRLFAYALGLITKAQCENESEEFEVDWNKAIGRQCIIEIEVTEKKTRNAKGILEKTGEMQSGIKMGGIYNLNDPEVEDIPRDADALARIGLKPKAVKPASNGPARRPGVPAPKKPNLRNL